MQVKQQVVVGVVYNPIMDELFLATQGNGAFLNGQPIRASQESELGKALIITEVGTARDADTFDAIFDRMRALTARVRGLRCCGSCALNMCSVACGRAEAFYEVGTQG